MDKGTSIGNRLKELRVEKGLTQNELAGKIGISKTAIFQYETNKRKPNFEALIRMHDFFKVPMEYIMGISDVRSKSKYYFENTTEYFKLEDVKKNIEERDDPELVDALYNLSYYYLELLMGLNINQYVDRLYISTVIDNLLQTLLSDLFWESEQGYTDFIECFSSCKLIIEKLFLDLFNKKSKMLLNKDFNNIIFKEEILEYEPLTIKQLISIQKY